MERILRPEERLLGHLLCISGKEPDCPVRSEQLLGYSHRTWYGCCSLAGVRWLQRRVKNYGGNFHNFVIEIQ